MRSTLVVEHGDCGRIAQTHCNIKRTVSVEIPSHERRWKIAHRVNYRRSERSVALGVEEPHDIFRIVCHNKVGKVIAPQPNRSHRDDGTAYVKGRCSTEPS